MNNRLHHIQDWPERGQAAQWRAATLANNCGVSLRTLERHFRKAMGKSPKVWLADQRQQRANELIQAGSSVKETAARLDYKHSTHLSRDYKEYLGCRSSDKTASVRVPNP